MKVASKRIWLAVALLTFAVIAVIGWTAWTRGPAQIITAPNGDRYRFAGATWGTNHSQPRLLAHIVAHLPDKWAAYVCAKLGPRVGLAPPIHTPAPELLVWFEPVGINATPVTGLAFLQFSTFLADGNGLRGGMQGAQIVPGPWRAFGFTGVPRRSRMLEFQLMHSRMVADPELPILHLRFPNPLFGRFPQWQPETLPSEKSDGDLRVQLKSFENRSIRSGEDWPRGTFFAVIINPDPTKEEEWAVDAAELSDATGNRINPGFLNSAPGGFLSIPGALWPEESALRLKLGVKRVSGFPVADLITFSNLPLLNASIGTTMGTSITNVAGGISVVVENVGEPVYWHGVVPPGPYWVNAKLPDDPPTTAIDIVKVVTDTGDKLNASSVWRPTPRSSMWNFESVPASAKFLNVTVAVQKERFVEFLAKPVEEK